MHIHSSAAVSTVHVSLSPADVPRWDTCPRQLWYEDICHAAPLALPASVVFDHCIEDAVYPYLIAWKTGAPRPDPVELFNRLWQEALSHRTVRFLNAASPEFLRRLGTALLLELPSAWERCELDIVLDCHGEPMIKKPLRLTLGCRGNIELEFRGCIGVLTQPRDPQGSTGLALLEVSPITLGHSARFMRRSDLLTGYQLLADAHSARWHGQLLERLGFWDFLKARGGARILDPNLVPARSPSEIVEYGEKLWWIAESAVHKRFTRMARKPFDCPCSQCAFVGHCLDQDTSGLLFPTLPIVAVA